MRASQAVIKEVIRVFWAGSTASAKLYSASMPISNVYHTTDAQTALVRCSPRACPSPGQLLARRSFGRWPSLVAAPTSIQSFLTELGVCRQVGRVPPETTKLAQSSPDSVRMSVSMQTKHFALLLHLQGFIQSPV